MPGFLREPRAEAEGAHGRTIGADTGGALIATPRTLAVFCFVFLASDFQHLAQENFYFQIEFDLLPPHVKWQTQNHLG